MPTSILVDIFIPCFVDQVHPEIGVSMVKILSKLGCEVHYNPEQTCCGQPAYNAGFFEEASEVALKFLKDFHRPSPRYIVTPSASCAGMVRNSYSDLLDKSSDRLLLKSIQKNTFELSEFIVEILGETSLHGSKFPHSVTYHDSCSALRELGIRNSPRVLLQNVAELKLIEMDKTETCCGFGGTFSVKFESISCGMSDQKIQHALATNAEYITSTDSSCLMHLDGYIKKNQLPIKTIHIAEILAANLI
jgi:L-lactate dehydrogenase complex protein LldE